MSYQKLFSKQASDYARFRPTYPDALYDFLLTVVPARNRAWDCATGNGQAALALAKSFKEVLATDASEEQLMQARPASGVRYELAPAERAPLPDHSIDLVTVAQAIHWFEWDRFYSEVRRVLVPRGILAIWGYAYFRDDGAAHGIVRRFGEETLKKYWPERTKLLQTGYRELPFPFKRLPAPTIGFSADWTFDEVKGYIHSWSSTQQYRDANNGADPFELIADELKVCWGDLSSPRRFHWDLSLLVGKI